ncbi:MAG: diacylglycerol kinase [Xanthomonadaceae bacterium]|nr:diacylglycerol kinase [Xanthomonadaceae bacterium]
MRISLIAALDRRFAIGKGNTLPWHLPADLKRFKALTLGRPVLMGRRTAESLGRALPGRRNLVLTHAGVVPFKGMEAVASVENALALASGADELCVIGGAAVFAVTLPLATQLRLTWIDTIVEAADVFFPEPDWAQWHVVGRDQHPADGVNPFGYEFVDYTR